MKAIWTLVLTQNCARSQSIRANTDPLKCDYPQYLLRMPLPKQTLHSFVFGLALLFLLIAGIEIIARLKASWVIRESRLDIGYTHEIVGSQTATWEFAPPFDSLNDLWIFYHPISPDNSVERSLEARLTSSDSGNEIASIRKPIRLDDYQGGRLKLDFHDLTLSPDKKLRLEIGLPENSSPEGFYLHYQTDLKSSSTVSFGSKTLSMTDFSVMAFASTRPFPFAHVVAGVLVLGLLIFRGNELYTGRKFALESLVATALATLIAGYFQDLRVERFFGNYWPDEYPAMAFDWLRLFTGELSWNDFHTRLVEWRNGQVVVVPFILGILQFCGASPPTDFQILTTSFTGATILLLGKAISVSYIASRLSTFVAFLALVTSPFLLRSAGYFQTDSAGLFFGLSSIILISRLGMKTQFSWSLLLVTVSCLLLAALTRLSNLPLLALPACLGIWSILPLQSSKRSAATTGVLFATSVVSVFGLLFVWYRLELFQSIGKSMAFANRPEFRNGFSWSSFADITLKATWPVILATLYDYKRVFKEPRLLAIGGGICALLSLLVIGKIFPWDRYWIPVSLTSYLFGVLYLERFSTKRHVLALFAGLAIAIHFWVIIIKDGLM